jgi:predicted nuclease of predicted toxin-antitoxin system
VALRLKLYADEHISRVVVRGLRQRGIDVLTVTEAGMRGASDVDHLAFALREGRVIFTQDDDFLRLHAAGSEHAGIVYARQGTPIGDIIRGLLLIHDVLSPDDMQGHLEFL